MNSASSSRSSGVRRAALGRPAIRRADPRRRSPRCRRRSSTGRRRGSSARRSRTRATRRPSSISGCAATRGPDARRSKSRTARSRRRSSRARLHEVHLRRVVVGRQRPAGARHLFFQRRVRIQLEQVERGVLGPDVDRARRRSPASRSRDCCGSHIIRSRLTLSNPAARASATASRARSAECSRPSRCSSASRNDWTPKLMRLTPAARNRSSRSRSTRLRIGLERDFGVRGDVERLAAGLDQRADFLRFEQRRRAAAEEDRVGRLARAPAARISCSSAATYRVLQPGVEQAAVEVAVVADGGAERDVEVEAEHVGELRRCR